MKHKEKNTEIHLEIEEKDEEVGLWEEKNTLKKLSRPGHKTANLCLTDAVDRKQRVCFHTWQAAIWAE